MAFILFAQSMFGCLIVIRILRKFRDRSLISATCLTKIGTAFALMASAMTFWRVHEARLSFLIIISGVFALQIFLKFRENRRIDILLEQFPHFVDHWLLNLRTGMSPGSARENALAGTDETFRTLMRPYFATSEGKIWSRGHLFLTARIIEELKSIQTQTHNTVPRLQNLRESLRRESDFRRKSGQAMRQAAIQSVVMVALHFALCAFVVLRTGWSRSADLIVLSSILTFAGVLILRLLARRIQWTV